MELLRLIVLAVVQGLTEFLPVSSSGHLVLFQHWLSAFEGDVFVDVVLHGGTLLAVVAVYARDLRRLLRFDAASVQYLTALAVATIPAVFVGLLLKDAVEGLFAEPRLAALFLIVTAIILLSTRLVRSDDHGRRFQGSWHPVAPGLVQAFLIGCAQAFAIIPGVSRSGSTIAASLWLGLEREEAARFSFLMSVPAIGGALVLHLKDGLPEQTVTPFGLLLGALVAFAVGLVAIRLTALMVVQRHFWKFSAYCFVVGVVLLLVIGGGGPASGDADPLPQETLDGEEEIVRVHGLDHQHIRIGELQDAAVSTSG